MSSQSIPELHLDEDNPERTSSTPSITSQSVVTCTRLHFHRQKEAELDTNKLHTFIHSCSVYSNRIVIAFNGPAHVLQALEQLLDAHGYQNLVVVVQVNPWGRFVNALNVLVQYALNNAYENILFQSLEVVVEDPQIVSTLLAQFQDGRTLVAGAALSGHAFQSGQHTITGRTCPWNSLALWKVRKLSLVGFLGASEGRPASMHEDTKQGPEYGTATEAGVEEVCTISMLQLLRPDEMDAKLVEFPGQLGWDVNFDDEARSAWHRQKMQSKVERPRKQLQDLNLRPGSVVHHSRGGSV